MVLQIPDWECLLALESADQHCSDHNPRFAQCVCFHGTIPYKGMHLVLLTLRIRTRQFTNARKLNISIVCLSLSPQQFLR